MVQQIESLESLIFTIDGYFAESAHEITYSEGELRHVMETQPRGGEPPKIRTKSLTTENLQLFLKGLNNEGILKWKSEYVDPAFCDGTQWELVIKYNKGRRKKVYGSNDYPVNFNSTITVLLEVFNDPKLFEEFPLHED
jgi:hypothetical protein